MADAQNAGAVDGEKEEEELQRSGGSSSSEGSSNESADSSHDFEDEPEDWKGEIGAQYHKIQYSFNRITRSTNAEFNEMLKNPRLKPEGARAMTKLRVKWKKSRIEGREDAHEKLRKMRTVWKKLLKDTKEVRKAMNSMRSDYLDMIYDSSLDDIDGNDSGTEDNKADMMTKNATQKEFEKHSSKMVCKIPKELWEKVINRVGVK